MRSRLPALLVLLIVLVTPATHPQDSKPPRPKLSAAAERWVEHTLKHMSTDEKIGQVIFPTYFGGFYSTESDDYQELMRRVERDHIGGFILATRSGPKGIERGTVYATATLANQFQRKAKIPLLICADFEHGVVMRIIEGTSFPEPMAVAATGRPDDAYTMGRITAIEARAAGVHWIYAPVADVNSNPDNPIINIRSFGEDAHKVSESVSAFVRGIEENGALSTAKHFPGHGDTGTDTHLGLALVTSDRARLDAVDLLPFHAAITAGVSSIMTGHLVVPALEPDPELPATLSQKVLTNLLRKEMGFDGLIVTDALDMGGVTNHYAPAEVAVRAFSAGADVLLQPPVPDAALLAMKEAVKSGRISKERLDDAVRRILRAKARLGLDKQRLVDVDKLNRVYGRPEFARAAQDIADRGVTLLRDDEKLLPIDARKPLRTLLVSISADPDTTPGYDFAQAVRAELDTVDSVRVDSRYFRPDTVTIPAPANYDLILIALNVRVADRKGTVGLPPDQAALVHRLLASGKPTVVASFGSPYLIEGFPEAKTWLAVFDTNDVGQRAAARALLGQVAITGKLPVRLPGAQPHALTVGDGLTTAADPMTLRPASPEMIARLKPAYDVVDGAIAGHVFPSAILAIGYKGELVLKAFGRGGYEQNSPLWPPDVETNSFDVPVISACIAVLVSSKQLTLDTPVFRVIPEWASGPDAERHKKVTIRHLLEHTSGLAPSYQGSPELYSEPLVADPGTKHQSSRSGFVLLAAIVARLSGQDFESFAHQHIFERIGKARAYSLEPRKLSGPSYDKGEVLNQHSLVAADMAAFSQLWLNRGIYSHNRLYPRNLVEIMTRRSEISGIAFAAGWSVPSEEEGTGKYLSSEAYGYTHEWGDSIWIDPAKDLFILFMPFPRRPLDLRDKFNPARAALQDAVIEGLGIAPPH